MPIRPATPEDGDAIWSILGPIIRAGDTYALPRETSRAEALAYWLGSGNGHEAFVAIDEDEQQILGTYYLRPNQPRLGGGGHVSNCGFMVGPRAMGQGVGRAMCMHALNHARARGYKAMQFNFVVSTNVRAVQLWQSCGFKTIGRLPKAFMHPFEGYVDALVMFREL